MLSTALCDLLRVLVLAGAVIALLPEDLEDRAVPASLQQECASKCPNLDLTQVRKISLQRSEIARKLGNSNVSSRSRGAKPLGFTNFRGFFWRRRARAHSRNENRRRITDFGQRGGGLFTPHLLSWKNSVRRNRRQWVSRGDKLRHCANHKLITGFRLSELTRVALIDVIYGLPLTASRLPYSRPARFSALITLMRISVNERARYGRLNRTWRTWLCHLHFYLRLPSRCNLPLFLFATTCTVRYQSGSSTMLEYHKDFVICWWSFKKKFFIE